MNVSTIASKFGVCVYRIACFDFRYTVLFFCKFIVRDCPKIKQNTTHIVVDYASSPLLVAQKLTFFTPWDIVRTRSDAFVFACANYYDSDARKKIPHLL